MQRPTAVVVFSAVDAVLSDPRGSAFAVAGIALREIVRDDVGLVLCSSKTRAELEFIQQILGIGDPFISENGAATFIPDRYFDVEIPSARDLAGYRTVEFGRAYSDVVDILRRTAERLRIEIIGFNDMSIDQVAQECRLPLLQARLAKLREYEERFRVLNHDPVAGTRLIKALRGSHLRCIEGSRFHYVGAPVDHRLGVNMLSGLYRRTREGVLTIGITDPSSDATLGDQWIDAPKGDAGENSIGVVGWAEAIRDAVRELRRNTTRVRAVTQPTRS